MATDPNSQAFSSPIRGHETRDANAKWVFAVVLFLLISVLAIHGILAGFLRALKHSPPPTDPWRPIAGIHAPAGRPPFPVLQVSPPLDLRAFRAREEMELQNYGWINRTSDLVRIPIDRAMEVVLQEGLPVRTGTNQNQSGPSSYQLIQQRPEHRQPEIKGER